MSRRRYHLHFLCILLVVYNGQLSSTTTSVDVGVIVDTNTFVGRMSKTSMELAMEDLNANSTALRLRLHTRDSQSDPVEATSAAIDLLKNYQVKAILGGSSREIDLVAAMGMKTQVPILSFTPMPGFVDNNYFIRMAQTDTSQIPAIASIIRHFNWTQLVPIYDDDILLFLTLLSDELKKTGATVPYRCKISPSDTDDHILMHLYKLMTMQTRVFLVHMTPSRADRLFVLAKRAGMMRKGYVWIIITNLLEQDMDKYLYDNMQGVIGVRTYIQNTDQQLDRFTKRWKDKFLRENPGVQQQQTSAVGLWAYDSVLLLAKSMEKMNSSNIGGGINSKFKQHQNSNKTTNLTDIQMIGVFESGPQLLQSIQNTRFKGISGEINLKNGEPPISSFQIINLVGNESRQIGIWTPVGPVDADDDTSSRGVLRLEKQVIWPGNSIEIPRGWETPMSRKKLRVGVPVKSGFEQFISVRRDPSRNSTVVTGFCKDVFEAVMAELPFSVPYEYEQFEKPVGSGDSAGSYDDLVNGINTPEYEYDVVVGDITIRANRSTYADFTLAYTESGVSMIVPVKGDDRRNAWIFTKPLTRSLWITIGAFFVYTGLVVWILEHQVNKAFHDPPLAKQAGLIMWFSFSTLVFAYTERVVSNLSRFVLIVWVFVVMVLTASYTASLTSFLTVQQLRPTVTDISDILSKGGIIGYQEGSFVPDLLKSLVNIKEANLRVLLTPEDYNEALSSGTVSAIVDELPYLRIVLGKYCSKFRMVGPTYKTAGFGFAFPRGSLLVPEVSRAILKVMESSTMTDITNLWFPNKSCSSSSSSADETSNSLRVDSFKGLFLIAGISSSLSLLIFLIKFLYQNKTTCTSRDMTLKQKLVTLGNTFWAPDINNKEDMDDDGTIEMAHLSDATTDDQLMSPGDTVNLLQNHDEQGMLSAHDGNLPSVEPPSPNHSYSIIIC